MFPAITARRPTLNKDTSSCIMPETPGPNFPATIVEMRDVYGLASETSVQTSTQPSSSLVSSNSDASRSSKSSPSFSFSRLLRKRKRGSSESPTSVPTNTPSSSRRSSIDSQETLSTPTSDSSKVTSAPRDYQAAFGALSSSYGLGGNNSTSVPVLPYTISTSSRTTSHRQPDHSSSSSSGKLFSQTDAGAEARFMYATTR